MAFPTTPSGSWTSDFGLPSRLFGTDGSEDGFELYNRRTPSSSASRCPGSTPRTSTSAGTTADSTSPPTTPTTTVDGGSGTIGRSACPKRVDDDDIEAEYTNGVLEVTIPIAEGTAPGEAIPIES
jgi:HSP20 family protein